MVVVEQSGFEGDSRFSRLKDFKVFEGGSATEVFELFSALGKGEGRIGVVGMCGGDDVLGIAQNVSTVSGAHESKGCWSIVAAVIGRATGGVGLVAMARAHHASVSRMVWAA